MLTQMKTDICCHILHYRGLSTPHHIIRHDFQMCFRFSVDCDYNQNKSNLSEETSMRIVLLKLQEKNISEISRHLNI